MRAHGPALPVERRSTEAPAHRPPQVRSARRLRAASAGFDLAWCRSCLVTSPAQERTAGWRCRGRVALRAAGPAAPALVGDALFGDGLGCLDGASASVRGWRQGPRPDLNSPVKRIAVTQLATVCMSVSRRSAHCPFTVCVDTGGMQNPPRTLPSSTPRCARCRLITRWVEARRSTLLRLGAPSYGPARSPGDPVVARLSRNYLACDRGSGLRVGVTVANCRGAAFRPPGPRSGGGGAWSGCVLPSTVATRSAQRRGLFGESG
jgi:hypothetical protein